MELYGCYLLYSCQYSSSLWKLRENLLFFCHCYTVVIFHPSNVGDRRSPRFSPRHFWQRLHGELRKGTTARAHFAALTWIYLGLWVVCCVACSSPGSNVQSDAENKDVTEAGVKQISVSLELKTRGNVGGAVGGREEITRGSVYRPFYFPVIFRGGRKKNIQRRCDNKGDKKNNNHVITACQVDNKVKFINIRTCTKQSSDKPQTKIHTHMHTKKTPSKTFNQNGRLFISQHTHKREKL